MPFTTIQNSFSAGEISPSIFGRTDLGKWHSGASTMRNFFVNYRGGAASRAGTAYVGMCKQGAPNIGGTPTDNPPRFIPFQFSLNQGYALEFGDVYMRIISNGAYVTESTKNITGATQANPCVLHIVGHGYSIGDWIFISGMGGMTNFDGLIWVVKTVPDVDHITIEDLFGNAINSTLYSAYTSGGTSARIYTVVSPYAAVDLQYLKYTQSADTMSLTLVNPLTGTDYPPYDLERFGATNWTFTAITFASSIAAPTGLGAIAYNSTTLSTYYSYVVTAVADNGEESIASSPVSIQNNDISINAGSNVLNWTASTGAVSYNVYAATPCYGTTVPVNVLYGFVGTTLGVNFVDTNIIPDFTIVPPVHNNPFPSTGNYPGAVAYYQQRRVYANTENNPDTYYMSQPGAFLNMDSSIPTTDSDAIVGAPWAQQINGIQFMVPMPGGLVILSGGGAWQLNGGNNSAITPANQTANPQAYNGCSDHVGPIVVNYDILYVQAKGSIIRDLSYNFFVNIYTGTDTTVLSNQLFNNHQIVEWAYSEEPFKLIWVVRDDGVMLSFTYLKEQDVYGWSRHDTNGLFQSVCSVTEPPVDALYAVVKRYIQGDWVYYAERMDDRSWENVEDCWCVDAGLEYEGTFPNATLTPAAANGTGNISNINFIFGGSGYTNPSIVAVDPTGQGTGATFNHTLSGGVITGITVATEGTDYASGTQIVITDTTGNGAAAAPIITNNVNFVASSGVFNSGMVGDVIRSGGGKAVITSYVSTTEVVANIIQAITATVPNDPNDMPIPQASGDWSISVPVSSVGGLNHLAGMEVAILADGSVLANQTVSLTGTITLPTDYSQIVIGLPFLPQLQSLYLDPPGQQVTSQGKRKNIFGVTIRMESSRGMSVGTNQPDASTQPNGATVAWRGLYPFKERNALISCGSAIPLFTGDEYIPVAADWNEYGQIAIQQNYPLPANVLAAIAWFQIGDTSG